jgi:hypothetical protein
MGEHGKPLQEEFDCDPKFAILEVIDQNPLSSTSSICDVLPFSVDK